MSKVRAPPMSRMNAGVHGIGSRCHLDFTAAKVAILTVGYAACRIWYQLFPWLNSCSANGLVQHIDQFHQSRSSGRWCKMLTTKGGFVM